MTDVANIQQLMERAEGAAHRGDFVAAEEALRLAVELQERTLGAASPEVASTLNNLGIVYERLDRPADAEASYRKSFAIARAAFGHDHPLVETSETNLREFCGARGIPFEAPQPPPRPSVSIDDFEETPLRAAAPREPVEAAPSSSRRPLAIGAVVVLAALIAIGVFASRRAQAPAPPRATPPAPAPATAAPPVPAPSAAVSPPPTAPARAASAAAPPVAAAPVPVPKPEPAKPTPATSPRPAATPVEVEVLDARLCQALDLEANWRCDPLADSTPGGPVFFVTRIKAARDATVEHRWFRNDRLAQAVTLRVRATGSGYRTYSRATAGPDRAGRWRVEVRGAGGAVLAEKTFVVGRS